MKNCDSCRHWMPKVDAEDGECRCRSPQLGLVAGHDKWASTYGQESCGDYESDPADVIHLNTNAGSKYVAGLILATTASPDERTITSILLNIAHRVSGE